MSNIKRDRKTYKIGALLLVVCLISTVMLSGTFAKYTSEYSGSDTALVARWDFKVSDGTNDLTAPDDENPQALDLFEHAYDVNINQKGGDDYIIAPGVNDEFTIKMNFLSDVDAKVIVDFKEDGSTAFLGQEEGEDEVRLPIEYSVADVEGADTWVTLEDLPEAFVAAVTDNAAYSTYVSNVVGNTFTFIRSGVDAVAPTGATEIEQTVKWRWAFDGADQAGSTPAISSDDATDTAFGNASAGQEARTTYILKATIKAEQIAPEIEGEATP